MIKAKEIVAWLEQYPETTAWIVLDDLDLHNEEVAKNQIRTNPEIGLTEFEVKNAISMLNT